MGNLSKCIFRRTVRSSKSLRPLRALQTLTTTERKKAKISNEDDFFTHKRREVLFDFGPFVLFSTMLVCLSFPPQEEKEKNLSRERDVAAEKRERFSFLVETSHHTKITHHHTSSQQEFFLLCDSTTPFLRRSFSFQRYSDKRNNVVSFCSFFSRRGLHVFVVAS